MYSPFLLAWQPDNGLLFRYLIHEDRFALLRYAGGLLTRSIALSDVFSAGREAVTTPSGIVDYYLDGEIHIR